MAVSLIKINKPELARKDAQTLLTHQRNTGSRACSCLLRAHIAQEALVP